MINAFRRLFTAGECQAHQGRDLLAVERSRHEAIFYYATEDGAICKRREKASKFNLGQVRERIVDAFVPRHYKEVCPHDYLPFSLWRSSSDIADAAISFFTTKAVLTALGITVGTGTTGAIAWVLKDVMGKLGKFAASYVAPKTDRDPGKWYLIGKGVSQAGDLMELSLDVIPQAVIPLSIAANIIKYGGWSVYTNGEASIEQHFSRTANMAEVKAKLGNQKVVASFAGIALAIALQYALAATGLPLLAAVTVAALLAMQTITAYKATKSLNIFNIDRGKIVHLIDAYLNGKSIPPPDSKSLQMIKGERGGDHLHLGVGLEFLSASSVRIENLISYFHERNEKYLLCAEGNEIFIAFAPHATQKDIVKSLLHARILASVLNSERTQPRGQGKVDEIMAAITKSYQKASREYPHFMELLARTQWDPRRIFIDAGETRVDATGDQPEP